jgi:hypothetical protein
LVEKHEAEPHRLAKKTTYTIIFIVILTATVYENVWMQQIYEANRISPERRMSRRLWWCWWETGRIQVQR